MLPKSYPHKEEYTQDELEKRKRQLSAKKGLVTKAKNALEKAEMDAEKAKKEISQAANEVQGAKKSWEETEKYKQLLVIEAKQAEQYKSYMAAQERLIQLGRLTDYMNSKCVEAEDAYHAVQEEYEKAEEEFEKFRIVYEQVNNPLTYSEIIRDQLQETRLNRDHVRQEVQNWSIISRASTAFGFVLILVAVILLFTSVGQIAIAALPGIVGAITIGASRLAFTQYNDSKKRFDAFSLRAENLQRELMGLSHRSIDSGAASQQSIDTNTKEPNANEPKDDSSPK